MPNKDLNTNEVIVNGQVIMTTRNDTVTPQTLVKDETATNKEGAKIRGELDPVSHDEAYLIDDPEGDIDDSDYIPFNDVSDEEQPKKKTLFSSIVDKLKTIFVSKSWGHVNVNLSSDSLEIKDEEVDVEQANNNITTTHYPSTDSILDKNGKSITRFQSQIDADGKIRATMYVRNFNTSGQSLGVNQISAGMDKSGNSFYEVTNHNKFREAIKTVDQLGTDIPSNADLNTYKTAGTYRVPSDAIGATISNLPLALCGKVVVFNNGNGGFEQFYFPNHSPRIFVRTWWSNAWSTWKEIGEGGGDSKAHTYEMGTNIPANSDFDDYKTEGVYYVLNATDASTISNIPVDSAGKLIVMDRDTGARLFQIYMVSREEIYVRDMSNDSVFSVWRNITRKHTYELGTEIPANSDLNTYTTIGVYQCLLSATARTMSNLPYVDNARIAFKLIVSTVRGTANIIQIWIPYYTNDEHRICYRVIDDNGTTWQAWKQLASTDDISPSTVGDGYAEATVSGSSITATISGFKLRAGVIVALKIGGEISTACTLNISSTGAKPIKFWNNEDPTYGKPIGLGCINTMIYDGTYYRIISLDRTPHVRIQDYVADTSGNILLDWGYQSNRVQLKYNISSDRLVWNYYKNSTWRGDRTLVEEIESGIIKLHRETTTADDLPVGLEASIKDTTTGKTYAMRIIRAYQDHQATPYGLNLLFGGGGETYIGAGEGAINIYDARTNKTTENLFLVADGNVFFYGNANTIADRQGFKLTNTGKLLPSKAETDTDNFGNIGDSATMWQGVYAHNMFLYSSNNRRTVVGGAHNPVDPITVLDLIEDVRFSNGAWGSAHITTAYTNGYTTVSTGWYNYFYIPHREGGQNWSTPTSWGADNVKYGTLFLFGMNNTNGMFRIRWQLSDDTVSVTEIEDLQKGNCYVGTCTTAGATKDKVATVDGNFVLRKGVRIAIKFSNTNTYSSTTSSPVTLNVNNTGAKNLYYGNSHSGTGQTGTHVTLYGEAGRYNYYVYDGAYWIWDGRSQDNNSTNFLRNDASSTLTASTPQLTLKANNIDITKANNGVTAIQYPAYIIKDKNDRVLSRLESIVQTDGIVQTYLYVNNYNTNSQANFNGGIFIRADKSGNIWYGLSNAYQFNKALGMAYATCSTPADTVAKEATAERYVRTSNGYVTVYFSNNVPANATLNINSQGAKEIWYKGAKIKANTIFGGDKALFIYVDPVYHLISVDRYSGARFNCVSMSQLKWGSVANTLVNKDNNYTVRGDIVGGVLYFNMEINFKTNGTLPSYSNTTGGIFMIPNITSFAWRMAHAEYAGNYLPCYTSTQAYDGSTGIMLMLRKSLAVATGTTLKISFEVPLSTGFTN